MEIHAFNELFPLFNTATPETMEWLSSIVTEEEYVKDSIILSEDSWGKSFYLIVSGWVKIQRQVEEKQITQEILGRGDFFGEMAIFDDSPPATSVVSLSDVKLLSISAQRFIQTLLKDTQVHQRILQLSIQRLSKWQNRFYNRASPPISRLSQVLLSLAESYGQPTEDGIEIYQIPTKDFAHVAETSVSETINILENIQSKGLLTINQDNHTICLTNPKQLTHLIRKHTE